jgi:type 1 fimbria pilin
LYILKKYNIGTFTDTSNNQNVLGNITAFSCTITSNTIEGTVDLTENPIRIGEDAGNESRN